MPTTKNDPQTLTFVKTQLNPLRSFYDIPGSVHFKQNITAIEDCIVTVRQWYSKAFMVQLTIPLIALCFQLRNIIFLLRFQSLILFTFQFTQPLFTSLVYILVMLKLFKHPLAFVSNPLCLIAGSYIFRIFFLRQGTFRVTVTTSEINYGTIVIEAGESAFIIATPRIITMLKSI